MKQIALPRLSPCFPAVFRLSALALFAGASALLAPAQQQASVAQTSSTHLVADLVPRPSLASLAGASYSSSASGLDTPVDTASAETLNFSAAAINAGLQPPPRRRYGRPRYNDSSHNPDGSNKYAFVVGAGLTGPVGNTYHYLNTNYAFQVGAGRNFNKNFTVMAQFDYDRFGFNGRTLYNQFSLYNAFCSPAQAIQQLCTPLTSLDGNTHVWSLTLNPSFNFYQSEGIGAYIVGAVGFYHKVASFTTPAQGIGYDYYYGYYSYTANQQIDHYTSNAPGFNGGIGLTYKPSRFAGERLFVEGRYVFVDNSQKSGLTVQNFNTAAGQAYANSTGTNYFPSNSNRTTYTVYKAGIRF